MGGNGAALAQTAVNAGTASIRPGEPVTLNFANADIESIARTMATITGKSVVVRINDRGPFAPGRVIDLSKAAADWMREQLQELEWDRITDGMLYARWYGHAVAECLFQPDLVEGKVTLADIRVRDRARFAYANDRGAPFIWRQDLGRWWRLPERKMWTLNTGADHDDSPYGLGLAHYCYWPVFFKRNNIKFWLVFLEKFGMPTAVAKMPAGQYDNVQQRAKVRAALQAMASETGVILPEGTEFQFLDAQRSGTQDYDTMRQAMDNSLAKIIIGQTASTQGTPGRLGNGP